MGHKQLKHRRLKALTSSRTKLTPVNMAVPTFTPWLQLDQVLHLCYNCTKFYTCVTTAPSFTPVLQLHQALHLCYNCTKLYTSVTTGPSFTPLLQLHQALHLCYNCTKFYTVVTTTSQHNDKTIMKTHPPAPSALRFPLVPRKHLLVWLAALRPHWKRLPSQKIDTMPAPHNTSPLSNNSLPRAWTHVAWQPLRITDSLPLMEMMSSVSLWLTRGSGSSLKYSFTRSATSQAEKSSKLTPSVDDTAGWRWEEADVRKGKWVFFLQTNKKHAYKHTHTHKHTHI